MEELNDRSVRESLVRERLNSLEQIRVLQEENNLLKENNDFLKMSFMKAPTPCIKLAPDGVVQVANAQACQLFGFELEEVVGGNLIDGLPETQQAELYDHIRQLTPACNVCYQYIHHITPGKRFMRSYLWCINGIFTDDGMLDCVVGYCLPSEMQEGIARQMLAIEKKGDEESQNNHRIVSNMLEMMQQNDMLLNRDVLHLINEQYHAELSCLFRYSPATNQYILEDMDQTELSQIRNIFIGMRVETGSNYLDEYKKGMLRVAYRDEMQLANQLSLFLETHQVVYESTLTIPVITNDAFEGVLVVVRERYASYWLTSELSLAQLFTRTIAMNIERAATQKELVRQQYFSKLALEKSEVYSWQYDVESDIFYNNENLLRRYGFPIGQQPVFNIQMFFDMVHPEDMEILMPVFEKLLNGYEGDVQLRVRINKPEGICYEWFEFRFIPLTDNGKVYDVIGTGTCIEKYKQAEQHLIDLLEAKNLAEENDRLKSAFIANMSHEIRTPLNAILGFSEILMETEEKEERAEYMKIIRNNNELLLTLINDILDISRIESGKVDFVYMEVDINELFDELYKSTQIRAQDTGLKVNVQKGLKECRMSIVRSRVVQIMMNFVNNAVKFTKKGSVTLGYELADEQQTVRFFVKDTGCGIRQCDQAAVFERFVKLNDFAQGTGLGLSICQTLVKIMNGKIGVVSKIGEGAEFWFTLPYHSSVPNVSLLKNV